MTAQPPARSKPVSKSPARATEKAPRLRKSKPRNADWAAGDAAKFFSYAEAWARIKLSSKQGYFLEAVATGPRRPEPVAGPFAHRSARCNA